MITTITGSNDYLRISTLRDFIERFTKTYGDIAIERVDANEATFERIKESLQSLPFLSARKLVILYSPSKQKEFIEQINELISQANDSTDIIIVEPKIDKRLSYYKTLKKITDFKEFSELSIDDLIKWASQYVDSQKGTLSLVDSRFLIDRVGQNQQLLKNELDKLILYAKHITKGDIELLSEATPQSTIFELLDAAFADNPKRTLRLYEEQRAQKVEPQQIMSMLVWQLHILAIIKTATGLSPQDIASKAKLNPFVIRKSQNLLRSISFQQIKSMVSNALTLDIRLKTESIDADEALQFYLLTIKGD